MGVPQVIREVQAFIESPDEKAFEELALHVFAYQFERNHPYGNLCRRRGITPQNVRRWEDIPKVPTSAFKHTVLATSSAAKVFRTSGTTQESRGEHHLPEMDLYQASWLRPFQVNVLPENRRIRFLSLIPREETVPDSSLSWMVARAMEAFGTPESQTFLDEQPLDFTAFFDALKESTASGEPVLILGTAFALAHVLYRARATQRSFRLPEGSRLMDTGGFKGRYRDVSRGDLLRGYVEIFGIEGAQVVGEYGMTEMCSQFYERLPSRTYGGPSWVRTQVLDPVSLEPLPTGQTGLLAHVDLANGWTVAGIITEDLGCAEERGGFQLRGRASGAELRGCSLTTEELLHEDS